MKTYHVYTSYAERQALPRSEYIIHGADTESDAIGLLYEYVKNGLQPTRKLDQYATPAITCGFCK